MLKKNVTASEITEPLKAFTPSSHETFKPEIFAENCTWSFNVQLSLFQDKVLLQQIWWGHWIFQYSLKMERFQKSDRVCIIRNLFKITWAHQSYTRWGFSNGFLFAPRSVGHIFLSYILILSHLVVCWNQAQCKTPSENASSIKRENQGQVTIDLPCLLCLHSALNCRAARKQR